MSWKYVPDDICYSQPIDDYYRPHYTPPRNGELWRGPHEGKELGLLATGLKPMASLTMYAHGYFEHLVSSGQLSRCQSRRRPDSKWLVSLPGEEWRMEEFDRISEDVRGLLRHVLMGKILGYSPKQIYSFTTTPRIMDQYSDLERFEALGGFLLKETNEELANS